MKKLDFVVDSRGVHIHSEAEERLTADQKYYIIMALIVCISLLIALHIVGKVAFLAAAGLLLMFGLYHVFQD